jgi:glutathione S-transferase
MLRLHGFSASNYYNIVKLALLEKGVPFEEVLVYTGAGPAYRPDYFTASPLGKVPCLETSEGFLSESRCMLDYLERAFPEPALAPSGAFAAAKMLELTQIVDLYLELAARRLLPYMFGRKPAPERLAQDVRADLNKGVSAVRQLAKFDTNVLGGEQFTAADIAVVIHFPMVRRLTKAVIGWDPFEDLPGLAEYLARHGQRPTVQRVHADQAANYPEFVKHLSTLYGLPAS